MKRFAVILSALLILLCAASCKKSGNTEPDEKVKEAEIAVTSLTVADKISIGIEISTVREKLDGTIKVSAKADSGETVNAEFAQNDDIVFDSPADSGTILIRLALLDEQREELDDAELKIRNGLVQLTEDSPALVVAKMSDKEKAHLVAGTGYPPKPGASGGTYELWRFGVPSITVNDGPAGVRYNTSVWYPSVMNMTSSWDGSLIRKVGSAMGGDSLALGIDIVLAPGMNIQKNVLGGRNFEYCSEDPLLTAYSASAYVKGMQSAGAGACLKHFAGNEQETNRGSVSSAVTERALREIYLKPFQLAVKDSSPVSIMSSYNQVNGVYSSINKDLLTGILRDEWHYKGMVMCDWGSAGAIEDKVNALNDIKMPGEKGDADVILAGIESGKVDMAALDKCCEHILYTISQSPTFKELKMNTEVDFDGHEKIARNAAADTLVLLKNDNGALPLSSGTSVALFGNGAYKTVFGGEGSGGVNAQKTVSIAKGIANNKKLSVYDEENNLFQYAENHSKTDASKDIAVSEDWAKQYAEGAGAAVIVISRSSMEGADNSNLRGDFLLNTREEEMIRRVADAFHAKGKKVTVLINTGSPIEVASWRDLVDAILFIGYPGQNAGDAVASVLCGEVAPSAKTTMTWPMEYSDTPAFNSFPGNPGKVVYYEDIYVGYRYYSSFDVKTAYPFGFGLSYTNFDYSDFAVTENADGTFTASVKITNKGKTAGREVVQIYVSKPETTLEQPEIELCGFAKTALLKPGKSEKVSILITDDALFSYDTQESRYFVDAGQYKFYAASSAETVRAEATAEIKEMRIVSDVENRCVPHPEPRHIIKSEYRVPVTRPAEDAFEAEISSKTRRCTIDLKELKEIGTVSLHWDKLDSPFIVSTAGEDQKYTRFDIYASEGLNVSEIDLCGIKARYIKIESVSSAKVTDAKVFPATEEDKQNMPIVYENIALKKTVSAASVEGNLVAANAVDGSLTTRWGSQPSGESWLRIDLGEVKQVKGMLLYLEAAWVPYHIEYSVDGDNYTTLESYGTGELFVKLKELDFEARYIRISREGESWFSIYEVEIYG